MLRTRLLLAAAILVPLLTLVYADYRWNLGAPGVWLFPFAFVAALLAMAELHALVGTAMPRPPLPLCLLGVACILLAAALPVYWPLSGSTYPADCPLGLFGLATSGLLAGVGAGFLREMWIYRTPQAQAVARLGFLALSLIYLGLPFAFLVALRLHHDNAWGMVAILSVIIVVKCADTGAYAVGKSLGRRKLSPLLSPNKTVEGAVGAFVAALAAALGCGWLLVPWLVPADQLPDHAQIVGWLGFGVATALAGMLGDLAESLLKRDSGQKDSSQWMPGLGGSLDVIDSLLFAAPTAYVFWLTGWLGPGS